MTPPNELNTNLFVNLYTNISVNARQRGTSSTKTTLRNSSKNSALKRFVCVCVCMPYCSTAGSIDYLEMQCASNREYAAYVYVGTSHHTSAYVNIDYLEM